MLGGIKGFLLWLSQLKDPSMQTQLIKLFLHKKRCSRNAIGDLNGGFGCKIHSFIHGNIEGTGGHPLR